MKANVLKLINGEYLPVTEEVFEEEVIDVRTYEEKVVAFIREKYSLDQELSIQRQREYKPEEFNEYFNYCEICKQKAKQM